MRRERRLYRTVTWALSSFLLINGAVFSQDSLHYRHGWNGYMVSPFILGYDHYAFALTSYNSKDVFAGFSTYKPPLDTMVYIVREGVEDARGFQVMFEYNVKRDTASWRTRRKVIRVGITFVNKFGYSLEAGKRDTLTHDSVFQTQCNGYSYIDTIAYRKIFAQHDWDQVSLTASVNFVPLERTRFAVNTGYGISAGVSYANNMQVYFDSSTYFSEYDDIPACYTSWSGNTFYSSILIERIKNKRKMTFGASAYVVAEPSLLLGKKKNETSAMWFFYHFEIGLAYNFIPEIGHLYSNFILHGPGFRVSW